MVGTAGRTRKRIDAPGPPLSPYVYEVPQEAALAPSGRRDHGLLAALPAVGTGSEGACGCGQGGFQSMALIFRVGKDALP